METKNMLYLVTEYAKNGEIFGEYLKKNFFPDKSAQACVCIIL